MDYLALLCTLHADGPETLQRLRTSGCRTLTQVAEFPASELQLILGRDPADVLRFQREALHLRSRVEGRPSVDEAVAAPRPVPDILDLPPASPSEEPPQELAADGTAKEKSALQALLDGLTASGPEGGARPAAPPIAGTSVEALLEHQVDREMVRRLREHGLVTLEDLLGHETRQKAQRAGVTYTQMLRLQFRARLALRQRA